MKKVIATVVSSLALLCAAPVFAQQADPAASAAAKELFESMNYRAVMLNMMQQMSKNMEPMMRSMLESAINSESSLSAKERKLALSKIDKQMPRINQIMAEFMNDPSLVDEMMAQAVPIYARNFTADEIRQIAAFYRTPVGAKMLAAMPKLASESMQASQKLMIERMQVVMHKLVGVLQE